METESGELPEGLRMLAEEFEFAAAPFDAHRSDKLLPPGHAASLELAGFVVGVVGLLVSLIGVYRTEKAEHGTKVPDFENLLEKLIAGDIDVDRAQKIISRWNPQLTPIQVGQLWKDGKIELFRTVLLRLGYPEHAVEFIIKRSFEGIAELEAGA